ncbi:hypothetical protein PR048_033494 [Dryococelus australis]|uniref:Uncharacterized protein n=1 Tax=Dryococelus australis TaxID=614101 RepID=A0ABQ9G0G6_9NEOP|nr:hypothetical protein PR048_033494 [Dryococelus australis]
MWQRWNAMVRGDGRSPRKPADQRHGSGTILACENPGPNMPGIEPGSPWLGASPTQYDHRLNKNTDVQQALDLRTLATHTPNKMASSVSDILERRAVLQSTPGSLQFLPNHSSILFVPVEADHLTQLKLKYLQTNDVKLKCGHYNFNHIVSMMAVNDALFTIYRSSRRGDRQQNKFERGQRSYPPVVTGVGEEKGDGRVDQLAMENGACAGGLSKERIISAIYVDACDGVNRHDTHKTPYDRVKQCRERKINIKASERVNVDPPTCANRFRIPAETLPYFRMGIIVVDDAAGPKVFSGISRYPPPFHSGCENLGNPHIFTGETVDCVLSLWNVAELNNNRAAGWWVLVGAGQIRAGGPNACIISQLRVDTVRSAACFTPGADENEVRACGKKTAGLIVGGGKKKSTSRRRRGRGGGGPDHCIASWPELSGCSQRFDRPMVGPLQGTGVRDCLCLSEAHFVTHPPLGSRKASHGAAPYSTSFTLIGSQDLDFESRSNLSTSLCEERRQNKRAGKTGEPRENPPTRGIVKHDSHMRRSGRDPTGNLTRRINCTQVDKRDISFGSTPRVLAERLLTHEKGTLRTCCLLESGPIKSAERGRRRMDENTEPQWHSHLATALISLNISIQEECMEPPTGYHRLVGTCEREVCPGLEPRDGFPLAWLPLGHGERNKKSWVPVEWRSKIRTDVYGDTCCPRTSAGCPPSGGQDGSSVTVCIGNPRTSAPSSWPTGSAATPPPT